MTSLRQYIQWSETQIGRVIVAERLHFGLLRVVQGPLTLTFQVRQIQGTASDLAKLLRLGPAFSQALQVDGVRIGELPDHIAIEIPSPLPWTPSARQLAQGSRGLDPVVGLDSLRRPVRISLRDHGALFWIGPSRRGKTQSMRSTLYALAARNPDTLRFAILCHSHPGKLADWQPFEAARACCGVVSDPREQEALLRWATSDLMTRIKPGNAFVMLVDDLLNLLQSADLAGPMAEIASLGAGAGIHLLAGTQEAGSRRGTGGAGVENNATAKILYRNSNAGAAARATGQGAEGVQSLSGAKGDALVLLDGAATRVATGLADDGEIRRLPQGEGWLRPWLHRCTVPPRLSGIEGDIGGGGGAPVRSGATSGSVGGVAPVQGGVRLVQGGAGSDSAGGGAPVQNGVAPVLNGAPETAEDRALVRRIYEEAASKNRASALLWGYKSRQTFEWLDECIGEAQ